MTSLLSDAMRTVRDAIREATKEPRSYGGRRQQVIPDDELADAISREDYLLELARRAIRKAA